MWVEECLFRRWGNRDQWVSRRGKAGEYQFRWSFMLVNTSINANTNVNVDKDFDGDMNGESNQERPLSLSIMSFSSLQCFGVVTE